MLIKAGRLGSASYLASATLEKLKVGSLKLWGLFLVDFFVFQDGCLKPLVFQGVSVVALTPFFRASFWAAT